MRADANRPGPSALGDMLRAWGLRRVPFAPDAKSAGLFSAAAHREALGLLETTAALRGVMVLTGSPGTGKSILVRNWMSGLDPRRHVPVLVTQSSLSATGVLEILLAKLGERPGFKRSANLLVLERHLGDIDPLTLVLVLDDAQNCPGPVLEEIRMLLGLGGRQRSAFALVLLGDEYLLGGLRLSVQRALFSRVGAAATLPPLARGDIAPYLDWHVADAGLERAIFEPAALDMLAEASEGNPRLLNLLAQAAWIAAARAGSQDVGADHIHTALRQVPSANLRVPQTP